MLTKEESRVIDLFRRDPFRNYTIRELMKTLSKKSYNWTFRTIIKLNKAGLVDMRKRGHSNLCSINLDNNLALGYIALLEKIDAHSKKLPKENIFELVNAIPLSYFTFIIAGSYAAGKATKESDLDIVVLTEDGTNTKGILTILKNKGELMIPEVHPYVFTKSEFLQMLLRPEENYGKMIFRNRLIVFGAENYYLILKEAIKHGFKG